MTLPTATELLADPIGSYPAATVACFDPTIGDLPRRKLDVPRTKRFLEALAAAGAPAEAEPAGEEPVGEEPVGGEPRGDKAPHAE